MWKDVFLVLIGVLLLAGLAWFVDVAETMKALEDVGVWTALALVGLTVLALSLKGVRWHALLRDHTRSASLKECLLMVFGANFLFFFGPNLVGDAYRGSVAHSLYDDVSLSAGLAASFFDKILTLVAMMVVAALGLFFVAFDLGGDLVVQSLIALAGLLTCVFVVFSRRAVSLVLRVIRFVEAHVSFVNVSASLHRFFRELRRFRSKPVLLAGALLLSLVIEGMLAWRFVLMVDAVGLSIAFAGAAFIYAASTLIGVLSMIPLGLGSKEVSITGLVSSLGGSPEGAAGVAVVDRAVKLSVLPLMWASFLVVNNKASVSVEQLKSLSVSDNDDG